MQPQLEQEIERHWSVTSARYNRWSRNNLSKPRITRVWREVLHAGIAGRHEHVLDVGTGTGILAFILREFCPRVTAVDISPGMLEQARGNAQWLNSDVTFRQADAEHLPFDDGTFTALVNRIVLWTLPHPELALAEWRRVLHPGGRLVIIDTNGAKLRPTLRHKLWKLASVPLTLLTERRNPLKGRQPMAVWRRLPLTAQPRPQWEMEQLRRLGFQDVRTSLVSRRSLGVLEYLKHGCWGDYFVVTATRGD